MDQENKKNCANLGDFLGMKFYVHMSKRKRILYSVTELKQWQLDICHIMWLQFCSIL